MLLSILLKIVLLKLRVFGFRVIYNTPYEFATNLRSKIK